MIIAKAYRMLEHRVCKERRPACLLAIAAMTDDEMEGLPRKSELDFGAQTRCMIDLAFRHGDSM